MPEQRSYVIVGNGIAGTTAAETLRNEDSAAEITLIGENPFPVYYRPSLKEYLVGNVTEETLFVRRRSFYADYNMRFLLDRALGVDAEQHCVQLASGRRIEYDRLLLAPGARARRLNCPGADLPGVAPLRTLADYQIIQQRLASARRVVVIGGGALALETIEKLRSRGMPVTHLLRRRRVWTELFDGTASELVLREEEQSGVDVRVEEEVAEIAHKNGQMLGVITRRGARIPCDLVILAIGYEPAIEFIHASGIACGQGVQVDYALHTSAPDVFAAGDAAEVIDPVTGRSRVLGQWYPSMQQGRAAAYSMLGLLGTQHLRHAGLHSSAYLRAITALHLYDFDIAAVGITNISNNDPGYEEILADPSTHIYSKVFLKNGVPVGMLSFDGQRNSLDFKRAIDHGVNLLPVASRLFTGNFRLSTWLDAQRVPTPVLAVRKTASVQAPRVETTRIWRNQFVHLRAPLSLVENGQNDNEQSTEPRPVVSIPDESMPEIEQEILSPYSYHHASIPTAAFLVPLLSEKFQDIAREVEVQLQQEEPLVIGRSPGAALVCNHFSISRRHVEITFSNGHFFVRDLGSKNGTFLNGRLLEPGRPQALKPRDKIRLGNVMTYLFQVRVIEPSMR